MNSGLAFEIIHGVVIQTFLLVLATATVQRFVTDSRMVCRLWTLTYSLVLALIVAALTLPHIRWFNPWTSLSNHTLLHIVVWQARLLSLLLSVWGIGFALVLVLGLVRLTRLLVFLRRECRDLQPTEYLNIPWESCGVLPNNLRILTSESIRSPFSWHLHCPTIVVPVEMFKQQHCELRELMIHELEHLRGNHQFQYFLQGLCGAILWFHPAIWWAARMAGLAREHHCDSVASRGCGVANYLRALANVAERALQSPQLTMAFIGSQRQLRSRMEKLVESVTQPQPKSQARGWLVYVLVLLIGISCSQVWLPVNAMASSRSRLSPWPAWSASILHDLGATAPDYERSDPHLDVRELMGMYQLQR